MNTCAESKLQRPLAPSRRSRNRPSLPGQKRTLLELLDHPLNAEVSFCRRDRCFKRSARGSEKARKLRGLLPLLRKSCWPDYEYEPSAVRTKSTGVRSAGEGMERGKLVHEQIETWVNHGPRHFRHRFGEPHTYTKKAVLVLRQWGLKPVIAEMTLYDPGLDIATKADLICLDARNELVLIEWKCGMDNYICRGTGPLRGPLCKRYSDSPLNQALVQLLFTRLIMEKGYGVRPKRAYVVQIHSDGLEPYPLPLDMSAMAEQCYQHVLLRGSDAKGKMQRRR